MASAEQLKEYLRDAFMEGALDVGRERKFLDGFVELFADEKEALIAIINHAEHLTEIEREELIDLAGCSPETVSKTREWLAQI